MSDPTQAAKSRREVFSRIRRGVVAIVLGHPEQRDVIGPTKLPPKGLFSILGTGFIYNDRGSVLTAGHVLDRAYETWVVADQKGVPRPDFLCVVYWPGRLDTDGGWFTRFETRYVFNSYRGYPGDVAVLRIVTTQPPLVTFPLELSTMPCELGDEVITCGFPLGLELHDNASVNASFAAGIVSAILPDPEGPPAIRTKLQLDAVVHGGSSGGPVCDPRTGQVIGMTIQGAARSVKVRAAQDQTIELPLSIAFAEDIGWMWQVVNAAERAFRAGVKGPIHHADTAPEGAAGDIDAK